MIGLPRFRRKDRLAATGVVLALSLSIQPAFGVDERKLSFYHTHTGIELEIVYARGGEYIDSALDDIESFLSDFRTGDARAIDPALLDLVYDIRESLGSRGNYEIISAYRSPQTNQMLQGRSSNSGVATKSQHLLGKAIDLRLQGVPTTDLRDAAIALQRGGVGFYEASNFVHVDTGRVRRW